MAAALASLKMFKNLFSKHFLILSHMKIQPAAKHISFHHLHSLFNGTANCLQLKPSAGTGSVQFYKIESGLQARLWNFVFKKGWEMFCDETTGKKEPYFTVAYLLNIEGLQFANNNNVFRKNSIWDTLFISSNSNLRMYVPPATQVICLNISFSKNWLRQRLLACCKTKGNVQLSIFESTCTLLEYMDATEKNLLLELIELSKKEPSTLHVKSIILKMLADFFIKLKAKSTLCQTHRTMNELLMEAETLLRCEVTGTLPQCNALARQYGFSEVSLKRHFKQRYGVNMSTYFMHKKMEYAKQFMRENNLSHENAALQLGYKNKSHFSTMLQKYSV